MKQKKSIISSFLSFFSERKLKSQQAMSVDLHNNINENKISTPVVVQSKHSHDGWSNKKMIKFWVF